MNGLIAIKACAASVCVVLLSSLLSPGMSLAQTTTHAASKGASIAPIPGAARALSKALKSSRLPRFTVRTARWR
ncbi:hypothetical protein P0D95_14810 [Pseudomonas sp. CBSPCAW29]|nr:hypothetical protein P0D95_14810 [Pseudomonas sp. CBSPCAW29]